MSIKGFVLDLAKTGTSFLQLVAKVKGMESVLIVGGILHKKSDVKADITGQAGRRLYVIQTADGGRLTIGADCLIKLSVESGLPIACNPTIDFDNFGKSEKLKAEAFMSTPLGTALANANKRQANKS